MSLMQKAFMLERAKVFAEQLVKMDIGLTYRGTKHLKFWWESLTQRCKEQ